MAKQGGVLGITGTVGGMTFDRNGVVRKVRPSNKDQFESAPSLARTRENAGEFGRVARAGKLLRQALRKQLQGVADRLSVGRLTKEMRRIEGLDTTATRGQRRVLKADAGELLGFNFNAGAPLTTVFFAEYAVKLTGKALTGKTLTGKALTGKALTLTLPGLVPTTDLAAPAGATDYGPGSHQQKRPPECFNKAVQAPKSLF